jgi:hypothetical protein
MRSPDHTALRGAMADVDRSTRAGGWSSFRRGLEAHFTAEEAGRTEVYAEHPKLLGEVDALASADPTIGAFANALHAHAAQEESGG